MTTPVTQYIKEAHESNGELDGLPGRDSVRQHDAGADAILNPSRRSVENNVIAFVEP